MDPHTLLSNTPTLTVCRKRNDLSIIDHRLKKHTLSISVHYDIVDIADEWDSVCLDEYFAKSDYLRVIEDHSRSELRNAYVLIYNDAKELIGSVLLQHLVLRLSESFNYENYSTNRSSLSRRWQRFRQSAVSKLSFNMLTVGNLYLTGQYGYHFVDESIPQEKRYHIVDEIVKELKCEWRGTPYQFGGVLYKDYFDSEQHPAPRKIGLYPFQIDPNMILPIRKSWSDFDDYLLDMRSKYRIRMKAGIRKQKGVIRRELSLAEVERFAPDMDRLYCEVLSGSGFVLAQGDEQYFLALKKRLGDSYRVYAYFIEDEMIGFYSWILDGGKLDSHFIGVNQRLNLRHQIYLNILLDLVRDAIEVGADDLYYYRTALEIKSSIGAEPHDMWCYFRHCNPVLNKLVPVAFKYFVPHQQWVQRHPFKVDPSA